MKKIFNKINSFEKGFTLIELMVSISIFMMIMLAAMGSLFVSLDAARRVRAQQVAIDSVNYAVESMTRSIRLGTKYHSCDGGCPDYDNTTYVQDTDGENSSISFVPQNFGEINDTLGTGSRIEYRLEDGKVKRCEKDVCASIVSPDVKIKTLRFDVIGSEESKPYHPRVNILVGGEVTVRGEEKTSFAIQTIATQRNLK